MTSLVGSGHGLFSLEADELELLTEIDERVVAWAREQGAAPERHAETLTGEQLEAIGYFDSFPHLGHEVRPILDDETGTDRCYLTSAACYGIYFARSGRTIPGDQIVTVRATCRRREHEYTRLRRQREFQMREVVALGTEEHVGRLLDAGERFMVELAREYGVRAEFEIATDPFFRKDDPRVAFQRVFPTKRELVIADDGLAIGSLNLHQTFFGEACGVALPDGEPISTGCVAFGLERWVESVQAARAGEASA